MTWKPDICIYHGNCDDGFGAAWAVWLKWGDAVEYVPATYGKPLACDPRGKNVLFVDFSLKRDVMEQFAARITVVLDHHKTAEAELAQWSGRMPALGDIEILANKANCETGAPIIAVFDMERSGAALAWEFCHGCSNRHDLHALLRHIEDRDLWRQPPRYHDTPAVSAALRTYPHDFDVWCDLAANVGRLANEGEIILRGHRKNVASMCDQAYLGIIGNHEVPMVNVPYHYASDCAHELLQRNPAAPFAAAWFRRSDGKRQFSLRSDNDRLDVSEIAKAMGGGGHRNAAGFELADRMLTCDECGHLFDPSDTRAFAYPDAGPRCAYCWAMTITGAEAWAVWNNCEGIFTCSVTHTKEEAEAILKRSGCGPDEKVVPVRVLLELEQHRWRREAEERDAAKAGISLSPCGARALRWAVDMFGPVATHYDERALRLVEEAIELAQAESVSKDVMLRLVERVYSRPAGDAAAEVGAVALTLEMVAENRGLDVAQAAEAELQRVMSKTRAHFAERHAAKAALGIANLTPALPKAGAFSNG